MEHYFNLNNEISKNSSPKIFSTNRKNDDSINYVNLSPLYILISYDFPENASNICKEFDKFGKFKICDTIDTISNLNFILIFYDNNEMAKIAINNYNPYCIDPFIKRKKINASIMTIEEFNNFIDKIYSRNVYEQIPKRDISVFTFDLYSEINSQNNAQVPKSNLRCFLEVFFNF